MAEFYSIDGFAWGEVLADLTTEVDNPWPSMVRFDWGYDNIDTLISDDARKLATMLTAAAEECDKNDAARHALAAPPDPVPDRCPSEEAREDADPLEGLPDDLARILRDQSVIVPQDAAVFEVIGKWAKAKSATASGPVCTCDPSEGSGPDPDCPFHRYTQEGK